MKSTVTNTKRKRHSVTEQDTRPPKLRYFPTEAEAQQHLATLPPVFDHEKAVETTEGLAELRRRCADNTLNLCAVVPRVKTSLYKEGHWAITQCHTSPRGFYGHLLSHASEEDVIGLMKSGLQVHDCFLSLSCKLNTSVAQYILENVECSRSSLLFSLQTLFSTPFTEGRLGLLAAVLDKVGDPNVAEKELKRQVTHDWGGFITSMLEYRTLNDGAVELLLRHGYDVVRMIRWGTEKCRLTYGIEPAQFALCLSKIMEHVDASGEKGKEKEK